MTHLDRDIVEVWRVWRPCLRRIDAEHDWRADGTVVCSYGIVGSLCILSAYRPSYPT